MPGSFLELQKRARYQELWERLRPWAERPWTWSDVLALLRRLGVTDPYGFLAAGWWLPPEALDDPDAVERLAGPVERAMAEGRFPAPEQGYRWEDLPRLEEICGVRPADVVRRLVWNYALTPGEEVFAATLRAFVEGEPGP